MQYDIVLYQALFCNSLYTKGRSHIVEFTVIYMYDNYNWDYTKYLHNLTVNTIPLIDRMKGRCIEKLSNHIHLLCDIWKFYQLNG